MILQLGLAALLVAGADPLPGRDKVKHFLLSAFVHSMTFSAVKGVTRDRGAAQAAGAAAVLGAGVLKEVLDRRAGRSFSVPDILWGAAGGVAAASLMNGTR